MQIFAFLLILLRHTNIYNGDWTMLTINRTKHDTYRVARLKLWTSNLPPNVTMCLGSVSVVLLLLMILLLLILRPVVSLISRLFFVIVWNQVRFSLLHRLIFPQFLLCHFDLLSCAFESRSGSGTSFSKSPSESSDLHFSVHINITDSMIRMDKDIYCLKTRM